MTTTNTLETPASRSLHPLETRALRLERFVQRTADILIRLQRQPTCELELTEVPELFPCWLASLQSLDLPPRELRRARRIVGFCLRSYRCHPLMTARELRRCAMHVCNLARLAL